MATIRDYTVTYEEDAYGNNVVLVEATNKTKVSYARIPTLDELMARYPNMTEYQLSDCFSDCVNMTRSPEIPVGATVLQRCFMGCTSLIEAPEIPEGVEHMYACFSGCTVMTSISKLPSSVWFIGDCFYNCASLTGTIRIDGDFPNRSYYSGCFLNTEQLITIKGRSPQLDAIASTGRAGNVTVWRPSCTWRTPVTNRAAGSRTTHTDMNRIADNVYLLGGYPEKYGYVNADFVNDIEWSTIVSDTNTFADTLGIQRATQSTSFENLNRIENIHKLYHEHIS